MAEFLTFGAQEILKKVASLAAQELGLLWGMRGELKRLRDSVSMIQAMLTDAEQKQGRDSGEAVGIWVMKLQGIAHEAEDVLDDYGYEVLRRKVELRDQLKRKVLDFFSHTNAIVFRHTMAHKIKKINASLRDLENRAGAISLVARPTVEGSTSYDRMGVDRETISRFDRDEKNIVGREELVSQIVATLIVKSSTDQDNCPSVLPIVGMGGLGKTTLAKKIYHDDQIGRHFNKKIWVCVSTNFEVKMILSKVLENLKPEMAKIQAKETILQNLQEHLKGKRYLLILDDVWNEDDNKWKDLINCLSTIEDTRGSRIILTTRKDRVASISHPFGRHDLKRLSDEQCWLILKDRALPDGNASLTEAQESLGKEIARKCAGLPLLAKVLGYTMRSKKPDEWRSIVESRTWDLPEDEENRVLLILKLSFDELKPAALKQCFANCSMLLSKGSQIEKDDLIQLWMAHGLLHPSSPNTSNREMEDIGDEYFNILWQNSFLQDVTEDFRGRIICRMHDLVHDLAIYVSKWSNTKDSGEARHRLRSVFLKREDLGILPCFKGLRVLNLEGDDIEELPASIGELKYLRYLNVSRTGIKTLPKSFGKLYNLQTLRMPEYFGRDEEFEFPKEVLNLINLRHVQFRRQFIVGGVGKLSNLRSLPCFSVGKEKGRGIEELAGLNQLIGELCICNLENVRDGEEAKKAKLSEKTNILRLKFEWDDSRSSIDIKNDELVLEALQPHSNLESLEIVSFMGVKFPSWMLNGCFAALKRLKIYRATNLIEWTEAAAAAGVLLPTESSKTTPIPITSSLLPSLRQLEIVDCRELVKLPVGLQYCTSLERLEIFNCLKLESIPPLHRFASLRYLSLRLCHALTSLLNIGLESCTALEELEIGWFSEELESFPAFDVGIGSSSQLKTLKLCGWPKLKSLPEQVQHFDFSNNVGNIFL